MTDPRYKLPKLTKEQKIGSAVIPGLTDPDALAAYKIKAYGRSLAPDDPLYGVTLSNLSQVALNNPGIAPDDALAMITGGVPVDSGVGAELTQMRQQLAAEEQANAAVAQETYQQEKEGEESWYGTIAKGITRFAFGAMSAPKEIVDNGFRTTLRYIDGNNDRSFLDSVVEMFTSTTVSKMAEGFLEHGFDTSDIDPNYDFGSNWLPEYTTEGGESLKRLHTQQYLGSAIQRQGKESMVWDAEANEGKGKWVWRDSGSVGQITTERFAKVDPTSAAYGPLSGAIDALSYLLDPSIFIPFGTTGKLAARIVRKPLGGADDVAEVANLAKGLDQYEEVESTYGVISRQWENYTEAEKKKWLAEHDDDGALEAQQKILDQKQALLDSGEVEQLKQEVIADRLAPLAKGVQKGTKDAETVERNVFALDQALTARTPDIDEVEERLIVLSDEAEKLRQAGQSPTGLVEDPMTQAEDVVTGDLASRGQDFLANRDAVGTALNDVLNGNAPVEQLRTTARALGDAERGLGGEPGAAVGEDVVDLTDNTLKATGGEPVTDIPVVTRIPDDPSGQPGILDEVEAVAREEGLEPGFYRSGEGSSGMYWTGRQFLDKDQYAEDFLRMGGKPIYSEGEQAARSLSGRAAVGDALTNEGISDPRLIIIEEEMKSLRAMRDMLSDPGQYDDGIRRKEIIARLDEIGGPNVDIPPEFADEAARLQDELDIIDGHSIPGEAEKFANDPAHSSRAIADEKAASEASSDMAALEDDLQEFMRQVSEGHVEGTPLKLTKEQINALLDRAQALHWHSNSSYSPGRSAERLIRERDDLSSAVNALYQYAVDPDPALLAHGVDPAAAGKAADEANARVSDAVQNGAIPGDLAVREHTADLDPFNLTPEDVAKLNDMRLSDGTPIGDLMKDVAELKMTIAGLRRSREAMDIALKDVYRQRDEAKSAYEQAARYLRDKEGGGGKGGGKGPGGGGSSAADGGDDPIAWLQAMAGQYNDGSVGRFHLDRALRFLTGQKGTPLVKFLAETDDEVYLWNMTRGKWPAELAKRISVTDSEDDVRRILAEAIADGGMHTGMMKARTLNAAARGALHGSDPNFLVSRYGKAWGVAAKVMNYGLNRKVSNVPWAHAYNTENLDDMVAGVSDMVSYVYRFNPFASVMDVLKKPFGKDHDLGWVHARKKHDEYVKKMMDTETPAERRRVYYEVISDMSREMGRRAGLDAETQRAFEGAMRASRNSAQQAIKMLAESRAAAIGGKETELMGVDPAAWAGKNMNPATLESELSFTVQSPDWHLMQRAMKSAQDVHKAYPGGKTKATHKVNEIAQELNDKLFERYWRTAVLAFRGGYLIRNVADMQVRMYLAGHPSLFTNPLGIISLAMAGHTNSKLMKKLQRANLDTRLDEDGNVIEFTREFDSEVLGEAVDAFRNLAVRTSSMADPVIAAARRVKQAGWKEVTPDPDHFEDFLRGWVNELQVMGASPMAREVLRVKYGRTSDTIANWAELHNMSHEDAVVDYFWNGPGRTHSLDPMIQSNVAYTELFTGKGMQRANAPEGDMIQGEEALRALFWGGGTANYASRWARLTNDGDNRLIDLLLTPREPKHKGSGPRDVGGEPLLETPEGLINPDEELMKQLRSLTDQHQWSGANIANVPVKAVRQAVYEEAPGRGAAQHIEAAVDWFFRVSNVTEKQLGYLPEFRAAKWDAAANYIRALSPEDAAKLVGIAEKTLGGKGVPLSWRRRTLAKMRREAAHANGSGAFTLNDMKSVTDQVGIDEIKRNFYDAQKRNQFAYSLRYVIPFGQAFANTVETWTRLALGNPGRVYAAGVLYRAGTGKDSNWMFDDPSNPEDSWIFEDPTTKQSMIGVPVIGPAMTALSNALPGPDIQSGEFQVHSPIQSGNLIFQNGLMPGFGPMISIPAQMLESQEAYQQHVPDAIKRAFIPYSNVDPNRDRNLMEMFTPGWVSAILSGANVPGFDNGYKKHVQPAMGMLYAANRDAYPHNEMGMLTEDGQRLLAEDANTLAHKLEFFRGMFMNMSPGALMGDFLVQTDDPARLGSQAIMAVEYQENMRNTGSREKALLAMADKYGAKAMLTLMSDNRWAITPTSDAYAAVKDHPELAHDHASVFSLIYPGGGYSPYMDRWNRKGYGNIKLTDDEKLDTANQLLSTLATAQLDRKLVNGEISQEDYDLQTETLRTQMVGYPTPDTDTRGRDNTIKSLRDAVANETLGSTPAGKGINEYLAARDYALEKGGWGGASKAQLRTQMRLIGEDITKRIPEFRVAWLRLFKPEIMAAEQSDAEKAQISDVASGTGAVSLDELRQRVAQMNDNIRAKGKPLAKDGDTIVLPDGNEVRLIGVDTVEHGEPGYGRSGRFTQRFIDKGPLQLENPPTVNDQDESYGRLLRYVLINNRDLGLALIRRGIARPFYDSESNVSGHTYQAHPKQAQYHAAYEANNEQWLGSYRDGG